MTSNFLTVVFSVALVVALLTGKAYFRGVASRDDDPARYWTIVGCYVALALAGVVFSSFPRRDRVGVILAPAQAVALSVATLRQPG